MESAHADHCEFFRIFYRLGAADDSLRSKGRKSAFEQGRPFMITHDSHSPFAVWVPLLSE
jgi:hypothetical protein